MRTAVPIIWWNHTVIVTVEGRALARQLPEGSDSAETFTDFVRALEPAPRSIRIFYHSPALEHFSSPCPNGSRRTIQRALSHRTPILDDPDTVWAAHAVGTVPGGNTLLYVEPDRRLPKIRAVLEKEGIRVEAALPLLVLIEEASGKKESGKARVVLATSDSAAAVFWVTAAGDRHAAFFDGPTARERISRELVEGFSIFKTHPSFLGIHCGSKPFDLNRWVEGGTPQKPSEIVTVDELLVEASAIGRHEVCNFLPTANRLTGDHLCHAAALALLFAATVSGATYLSGVRAARANVAAQLAEEQRLGREIEHLRMNQEAMTSDQAVIAEAGSAPALKLRFLEALNRARPIQISIESAVLNESSWTVVGRVHEGAGLDKGPFQSFLAALQKDSRWAIASDLHAPSAQDPEFMLSGTFQ